MTIFPNDPRSPEQIEEDRKLAEEWATSTDPAKMLAMITNASERKLQLLLDSCRRVWKSKMSYHQPDWPECKENRAKVLELLETHWLSPMVPSIVPREGYAPLLRDIFGNPFRPKLCPVCNGGGGWPYKPGIFNVCSNCDGHGQVPDLITIDPRWLTSDVVGIAHAIYEENAWERMPILADALMDAGCENAEMMDHCRNEVHYYDDGGISYWYNSVAPQVTHLTPDRAKQATIHIRGCWVVDALLNLY